MNRPNFSLQNLLIRCFSLPLRIDAERFHASFERALVGMSTRTTMGRALPFLTRDAEWQQARSDIHTILDNYITNAISEQK